MTPWSWWWLPADHDEWGGWEGDCATREQAIAEATRDLLPGTTFDVIEARSSQAARYEEADCVPFLRMRNRETLQTALTKDSSDG